jgi:hypothetical protein
MNANASATGALLKRTGSHGPMVYLDKLRPEEKLAHDTQEIENYEQLPLTRSKPYPDPLPGSLNSPEQIMREQQEAKRAQVPRTLVAHVRTTTKDSLKGA